MKLEKTFLAKSVLTCVTLLFTTIAFAQHSTPWNVPETEKSKKNLYASDASSIARGKKTYKAECFRCHGKEGKGDGSGADLLDKQVADLTSDKIQNQTDGELFWKISEGRKPMPLAKHTLTDDQRWDIINYIRTFKKK
ncbi:MAG: cytochrome c [Bacteroidota bacterium]